MHFEVEFGFEKKIFEEIIKAYTNDQNHPQKDRAKKPFPEIEDLISLIETAFWSSLKQEEGRIITFSIVLLSQNELKSELSNRKQKILPFKETIPFTTESITKLASAFNPKISTLIVKKNSMGILEIWGSILFGYTKNRFSQIPASTEYDYFRPDALTITAVSAGSLLISRADSILGHFVNGEFMPAIPTPFTTRAMGNHIIEIIKDHESYIDNKTYWHIYRDSLDYLLSEISTRSHGGAVVILPENEKSKYLKFIKTKYSFSDNLTIKDFLKKISAPTKADSSLFSLSINQKYLEHLDALAQLACIDGALILSSHLEILTFGATLDASKWEGEILIGPDGLSKGGALFNASKLGTRHNSMINFIGMCQGAIGFVISQDGPIRGFVRISEETILCWPDCSVSMFI